MAWVIAQDVKDSWIGEGAPTDDALLDLWIGRAERLVRRSVPDLQARLDAEAAVLPEPITDLLDTTKDIVVSMVIRLFRNPEGIRSTNLTTGPFSENRTYAGDAPGGLHITDDELSQLQGGESGQTAYAVDTIPLTSPFHPANFSTAPQPDTWIPQNYYPGIM